jgi:hypothetical protein
VCPKPTESTISKRKNRPPFRFSFLDVQRGTVLLSMLTGEQAIVASDSTVIFRGKETSLSAAAHIIAKELGYEWRRIEGPRYWRLTPAGYSLSDMRRTHEQYGEQNRRNAGVRRIPQREVEPEVIGQ